MLDYYLVIALACYNKCVGMINVHNNRKGY